MTKSETIVRFDQVTFGYDENRMLLDEVKFNIRRGSKIALMGQNGAGKSTIFKLITQDIKPINGLIHLDDGTSIAISKQVMAKEYMELTLREYLSKDFAEDVYDEDRRIKNILEVVNFDAPYDKQIKNFSGGQQARLLLASALIQEPDLLLLDEPTNNLDTDGIDHLIGFLMMYEKTAMVISHDAEFLNLFTDGVLYLDSFTQKIEQYVGDYLTVVDEIKARIEKENMKNSRLIKEAKAKRDQAEKFAHKGGKLRLVARKMRDAASEMQDSMVDVRREDVPIRDFQIDIHEGIIGSVVEIKSLSVMIDHKIVEKEVRIDLHKNQHLLLKGPNGIGKTTLLESLATGKAPGAKINPDVVVGYYRQDFSTLDFDKTGYETLEIVEKKLDGQKLEGYIRSVASRFQLSKKILDTKVGHMSEGQKGLLAFAQLMILKPGLLILDEPTNHINFRHLPIIAKALSEYKGAMILVSHVQEFIDQIRIDEVLDLGK